LPVAIFAAAARIEDFQELPLLLMLVVDELGLTEPV
jgi:hypothetical protein